MRLKCVPTRHRQFTPFDRFTDFLVGTPLVLLVLIIVIGLLRIKLHTRSPGTVYTGKQRRSSKFMLSQTQTAQFRETFKAIDTDNSGAVDVHELRLALEKQGTTLSEQEAEEILAEADTDGDGKLSLDEFIVAMASKASGFKRFWWRQGVQSVLNQHVFAALLLSFVVLPAASSKIFRMLTPCLEELPDGTRLHRADLAVDCASASYERAYATAIVMIFVCASLRCCARIAHILLRNARSRPLQTRSGSH